MKGQNEKLSLALIYCFIQEIQLGIEENLFA